MKTELTRSFTHGFELTEQELRRIYDTIVTQINVRGTSNLKRHFEIKYKNGIQSEKASLDEVLKESNSNKWLIRELRITVERTVSVAKVTIHFRFPPPPTSKEQRQMPYAIEYTITGDERDWVYLTGSQFDDRISKIKLLRVEYYGMFAIVFGIVGAIVSVVSLSSDTTSSSASSLIHIPLGYKIIILISSLLVTIGGSTILYGFPQYNFYWGDYMKFVTLRRSIAKYILSGIIVALVLGTVGSIFSTLFFLK